MNQYRVELPVFSGPLDLLLHLIAVSYTHLDVYKRQSQQLSLTEGDLLW